MKKIFTVLLLLCTISVFAANASADTYTGKLNVSVNGKAPSIKDPQSVMVTEGDVVTLTIPDFTITGITTTGADVVITATKNNTTGELTLKTIKYGFLPILSAKFTNSTLINGQCHISLSISAIDKVEVTFDGSKQ